MRSTPIPQPFLNWMGVWPGQAGSDESGRAFLQDPPRGIRLRLQQARKSEVILRPPRPWERSILSHLTILLEGGRYRMWYFEKRPPENPTRYAESDDGYNWEFPELGLYDLDGSTANNALFGSDYFMIHSLFRDPTAEPPERYKAIERQKGDEILFGAVSPDGLRWTRKEEPLLVVGKPLDTQNIAAFDEDTGEYLAFLRGGYERRRSVTRTGGPAFGNWHAPRYVMTIDGQDVVDEDLYTNCYCRSPGSRRHLMFPTIYHRLSSTLDVQLATSIDGWLWERPVRQPIITREADDEEYGAIYACPNLVPVGDDWGVMCHAVYQRHDGGGRHLSAEERPKSEYRWALWEPDRLMALEAPDEGGFTTTERDCAGVDLRLNYRTRIGGWMRAALVEKPRTGGGRVPAAELEGFGTADCDVLEGDELSRVVSWKGRSDLSKFAGREVCVRFTMARAELFSVAV